MKKKMFVVCSLLIAVILSSACTLGIRMGDPKIEHKDIDIEVTEKPENTDAEAEEKKTVPVTVKGEFAAHVIDIIPDYVFDGETPKILLVACFQMKPFLLEVSDALLATISKDKSYLFTIEEKVLRAEFSRIYHADENLIPELPIGLLISLFELSISSIEEIDELGMGVSDNCISFEPIQ